MSHDSVFSPEHNSENDMRNAQSIQNLAMQELMDRLHPQHDSDEDDAGLPHSPCTSPTTAEVLRQGLRETSGKSRSTCSDGSLLSMGSSETDEDSLMLSSRMKLPSERHDGDGEDGAAFPLSHKAAHHKISVRPKRTHAVGRHRKLQQLTVASLPATPEDIEDMRVVSPDRSWHSVGEQAAGSSGSISRASSVMSTSDSTGSLSASASPTRKKVLPTSQELEASVRARSLAAAKQDDRASHHRRRTFSESPHREQDLKGQSEEARKDKVHSLSTVEGREIHATVVAWGYQSEMKKEERTASPPNRQGSPVCRERAHSLLATDGVKENGQVMTEDLLRSASPVRQRLSRGSASSPNSSPEQIRRINQEKVLPPLPKGVNVKTNGVLVTETENVDVRRSVQRDPSYRVAVHESKSWVEANGNELEKTPKKEENSSSLFGFGSKKKTEAAQKEKEKKEKKEEKKEKKEEKLKEEKKEKKADDSPFFSRFWGSRRSNKKKKDKKDDDDANLEADIEEKEEPVVVSEFRRQSDFPQEASVDVKAMIQSITARSTFHPTSSFRCKEQDFEDGKPVRPLKPKPLSAKSLESLGPKAFDVVPVDLDSNHPPTKSHLSGSLPKLDTGPVKIAHSVSLDTGEENANSGVMLIEGELVRLRKKAFCGEEKKTSSPPLPVLEKGSATSGGDQKRHSKRSSLLSWYSNKKDSSPAPDAKADLKSAGKSSETSGSRFWSSKKTDVSQTPKKPVKQTPETNTSQQDQARRDSISKIDIYSKRTVETPRKTSLDMSASEKCVKPVAARTQVTPKTVDPPKVSKRRPSASEGNTSPFEKSFPSATVEKPAEIMTLDSSPQLSFRKKIGVEKVEVVEKSEENGSVEGHKLVRGSVSAGKDGDSELLKVFHRRSLKIKDKEPKHVTNEIKDEIEIEVEVEVEPEAKPSSPITDEIVVERSVKGGMSNKMSKSFCSEPASAPGSRVCSTSSSGMATSNIEIVAKNGEKMEGGANMPEWRRIAQQRREQREMREKQHVTGNGHVEPSIMLQATPKHSGRSKSKVLDMVSNFQKLQVS
uniref:Uncharacterized protein n=1 Tax=Strigamia maritima TaxID=126957 RepID=T1INK5_STRMM